MTRTNLQVVLVVLGVVLVVLEVVLVVLEVVLQLLLLQLLPLRHIISLAYHYTKYSRCSRWGLRGGLEI